MPLTLTKNCPGWKRADESRESSHQKDCLGDEETKTWDCASKDRSGSPYKEKENRRISIQCPKYKNSSANCIKNNGYSKFS